MYFKCTRMKICLLSINSIILIYRSYISIQAWTGWDVLFAPNSINFPSLIYLKLIRIFNKKIITFWCNSRWDLLMYYCGNKLQIMCSQYYICINYTSCSIFNLSKKMFNIPIFSQNRILYIPCMSKISFRFFIFTIHPNTFWYLS